MTPTLEGERFAVELSLRVCHGLDYSKTQPSAFKANAVTDDPGLFVSLLVWGFTSDSRIFHSYGDVTIAGQGLQVLTSARHSWPLSREGSLTCHNCCDTGLPFIMVISEDPWHSHMLPSVWQWSWHKLFLWLRSVATGDLTPISRIRGERSTSTPPRRP